MICQVRQIAKCVVVTIPAHVARAIGVKAGSKVEVKNIARQMVVQPITSKVQLRGATVRHAKEMKAAQVERTKMMRARPKTKKKVTRAAKKSPKRAAKRKK